ncbi:MAG TPA: replication initiation protein [Candidatus Cloacimonadota bacterium]|nr:replication initiation protein [Candidatus Cloacimonadota bacterium]
MDKVDQFVIKHSAAVQISNNITLLQRRTWNILLANAYESLLTKDEHCIDLRILAKLIGLERSNNDAHLKELLLSIVNIVVEWNTLGKDKRKIWEAMSLLSRVKIDSGVVYYSYERTLAKRLFNPSIFAKISLSMQNKFESKHSLALYELCLDYFIAKRQYGYTPIIPVDVFRSLMGLNDSMYKTFKAFNQFIIKPSLEEINSKSDIRVTVNFYKEKRAVTGLSFVIEAETLDRKFNMLENKVSESMGDPHDLQEVKEIEEVINNELYNKIKACGLTDKQTRHILRNQDEDTILNHLQYINSQKNITNMGAYALKVFEEREIPEQTVNKEPSSESTGKKINEEALKYAYDEYITQRISEHRSGMSEKELEEMQTICLKNVKEKHNLTEEKSVVGISISTYCFFEESDYIKNKLQLPSFDEWKEKMISH